MEFSEKELQVLTHCGNTTNYNNYEFKKLIGSVDQRLCNIVGIENKSETEDIEKREAFQTALCLFVTVCAKENLEYPSFHSFFCKLKWDVDRIKDFWSLYESKKAKIRWNLSSCTSHPPTIVDIKWKLDYIVKNSGGLRSGCLAYVITLYLDRSAFGVKQPSRLTFTCSLAQLTHFVTHLRQATRCIRDYGAKTAFT